MSGGGYIMPTNANIKRGDKNTNQCSQKQNTGKRRTKNDNDTDSVCLLPQDPNSDRILL